MHPQSRPCEVRIHAPLLAMLSASLMIPFPLPSSRLSASREEAHSLCHRPTFAFIFISCTGFLSGLLVGRVGLHRSKGILMGPEVVH